MTFKHSNSVTFIHSVCKSFVALYYLYLFFLQIIRVRLVIRSLTPAGLTRATTMEIARLSMGPTLSAPVPQVSYFDAKITSIMSLLLHIFSLLFVNQIFHLIHRLGLRYISLIKLDHIMYHYYNIIILYYELSHYYIL